VSVYAPLARSPTEPWTGTCPAHVRLPGCPEAWHEVTFAVDHLIVTRPEDSVEPLERISAGAVSSAVALAAPTVVDLLTEPPAPVHVSVYVPACQTETVPERGLSRNQLISPIPFVAEHEVAFVDDQVSIVKPEASMSPCENTSVGAGVTPATDPSSDSILDLKLFD